MRYLFVLLLLLPGVHLLAQQDSRYGNVHTPEGDLHVLVIFIRYENVNLMRGNKQWPDSSELGALPKFARGETNRMFHQDPDMIGIDRFQNMSDFYYTMSGGKFRMSADIYPRQVPIQYIPERRNNFFARQGQMNQAAINWIAENDPDFDWGQYDSRTNRPNYKQSNVDTPPDSVLDYVIFMHRAPGSTGMGASSNLGIPGSRYRILDGHTGIKSYADRKHNWLYFKHEFAHNLFSCPHYLGANSADGDRYYTQKGWGMMSGWHSPFFMANAWEAWWLNWLNVQEITESGTYPLRDYLTGRDAIRINIPGTQDYLWLENHQKIDQWDDKLFFKDPNQDHPQMLPGLYGYVVGAPGASQTRPGLSPFAKNTVNFIRPVNADGNFDWRFTGDSMNTGYFRAPVMEKVAPNPIAGQHAFQFIRADYNGDNRVDIGFSHGNSDSGGKEHMDIWVERINGEDKLTIANTGDENDGFQVGEELSLSSLSPVVSYPVYDNRKDELDFYVLSGIRVRILEAEESGTMNLDIQLDDWNIRGEQRFCGRILLPPVDRINDSVQFRITRGSTLSLEVSGTPQRRFPHPVTETFAPPTELVIGSGQTLVVERRATLRISEFSALILEPGASLVVERGGRVEAEEGGGIIMESGTSVSVGRFGRIIFESPGNISMGENVTIDKEFLGRINWEPTTQP